MQSLTLYVVGSVVFSLYLAYDLSISRSEYAEDNRSVAASLAICMSIIHYTYYGHAMYTYTLYIEYIIHRIHYIYLYTY
jgi:hypothetical protein